MQMTVMAESETGLQTNLDLLKAYCDLNHMYPKSLECIQNKGYGFY